MSYHEDAPKTSLSVEALKALMPGIFTGQEELLHTLSSLQLALNENPFKGQDNKSIHLTIGGQINKYAEIAPLLDKIQAVINATWNGLTGVFAFSHARSEEKNLYLNFYSTFGPEGQKLPIGEDEIVLYTYPNPKALQENPPAV